MLPLRLVIDTNVVVSAALKPDGLERVVFLVAITKPVRWYISRPVLEEYSDVLRRPQLQVRKGARVQLVQLIRNRTHVVLPSVRLDVTSDPADNKFVECAEAARADYLVTGNRKHFPRFWKMTKIITPRDFLELIAPHLVG